MYEHSYAAVRIGRLRTGIRRRRWTDGTPAAASLLADTQKPYEKVRFDAPDFVSGSCQRL
jgi:hypothetical protein